MLSGGCYCGYIRYEATGRAFHETLCHCSICRRTSGAPCVAWFSVPRSGFRVISGHPATFNSTPRGIRSFCPQCGTQLSFEHSDFPDELDITTASLDDPERLPPQDHTHHGARLRWLQLSDALPQFHAARRAD